MFETLELIPVKNIVRIELVAFGCTVEMITLADSLDSAIVTPGELAELIVGTTERHQSLTLI